MMTWVTPCSSIALRKRSAAAEDRDFVFGAIERFFANDPDRAQSHLGFAADPTAQLPGLLGRTDEEGLFFLTKDAAGEEFRQKWWEKRSAI